MGPSRDHRISVHEDQTFFREAVLFTAGQTGEIQATELTPYARGIIGGQPRESGRYLLCAAKVAVALR